jgi:chromosome segregation ATPase
MPEAKSKPNTKKPAVESTAARPAAKRATGNRVTLTPEQRYHMIAEAAYFRAERRGFIGGDPAQDWLDAEAEIDRILQAGAGQGAGASQKEAFQARLEAQLQELNTRLEELKLKAGLAKLEVRSEYEKQLETLSAKQAAAQARLNELRQRAEGAWEDLRGGTEKAWEDMRDALERLASRFK